MPDGSIQDLLKCCGTRRVDEWACGSPDIVVDNDLHIGCQSISNKGGYEYTNKMMVQ